MSKVHKSAQRLKATTRRIKNLNSKKDREDILKVKDEALAHGISKCRTNFYLIQMQKMSEWTKKDLRDMDKEDIKKLVAKIESKDYSERTKKGYKLSLKKFFQTIENLDWKSKKYPDKVEWIKTTLRESKLKKPDVLTKEEIKEIFKVAEGLFEKALVTFMYETGCRVDECLKLSVSDVDIKEGERFDKLWVKLKSGKVGERKNFLVLCVPYLKEYLNTIHPDPKPDKPLWYMYNKNTQKHKVLNYYRLRRIVKKWGKKAGIKNKNITPYIFRKSLYTHLSNKFPTPMLYNGTKARKWGH